VNPHGAVNPKVLMTGTATQQKQQCPDRRHQSGTLIGFLRPARGRIRNSRVRMHPTVPDQKIVKLVDKECLLPQSAVRGS
jgi:hypothetical protein